MYMQRQLHFLLDWMGLPALLLLAAVLIYRKWFRSFPFFFVYVLGAELVGVVRLLFRSSPFELYSNVYWISDTALAVFAFLATYELFFRRLFPGFHKTRLYRYVFPAAAILILLAVTLIALLGSHSSVLPATTRIYELLRAAVLFFFVALMLIMGRRWDRQEFGIAFGFALDVATSLALIGIWSHTLNRNAILGRLSVIAYDLACVLWIYCFWQPRRTQTDIPPGPAARETMKHAKQWEESLKD